MLRVLLLSLLVVFSFQVQAQKNKKKKDKKENKIPALSENFTRFSVFAHEDNTYIHKETSDVYIETFLDIQPKEKKVLLPGLGDRQSCTYTLSECNFVENEDGLHVIILPIECGKQDVPDKRIMRIHLVKSGGRTGYLFSLSYLDAKDLVLFHNYSDNDLGLLLTKNSIWFE